MAYCHEGSLVALRGAGDSPLRYLPSFCHPLFPLADALTCKTPKNVKIYKNKFTDNTGACEKVKNKNGTKNFYGVYVYRRV